jgi:hypothetical protein
MEFEKYTIKAKNVKSLCWQNDSLIDWAGGGALYHLDGKVQPRSVNYAYRFDSALTSPSGKYAVIYEKLGTKALILENGKILREINRSFYHANAYEYPLALFQLSNGREVMAHCPETYCQLEIDDLATGECLTKSNARKPRDYFFSRLTANLKGTMLLAAGWVWHPMDVVYVYDIELALQDPHTLDEKGIGIWISSESNSASFMDNDTIAIAEFSEKEEYENEDDKNPSKVYESRTINLYELASCKQTLSIETKQQVGTFMPIDSKTIVSFFEYPKLISLETGKVLHEWKELKTGKQSSSIIWGIDTVPPLALDSEHQRFAVATDENINVVQIRL